MQLRRASNFRTGFIKGYLNNWNHWCAKKAKAQPLPIGQRWASKIANIRYYFNTTFLRKIRSNVMLNNANYQNAERWIIGTDSSIFKFLKDQEEYSKPSLKKMEEMSQLVLMANKLAGNGVD